MSDVHALVGAYAVDAVDDLERAAFERHLAECPDCRAELAGLREASGLMAATASMTPPDRLREQVLTGIGSIRPLPPQPLPERETAPSGRRFRPAALLAAAAAVVALSTGGAVAWQQLTEETSQPAPTVSAADRVLAAEDAEEYTQRVDGVEVSVVRSRSLNKAVLVAPEMPAPPEGKLYELWLDHGEGMVPAGLMTGGEERVLFEGDPADAIGAGITIEPAPEGSKAPTTPAMLSFTFEKT